MTNQDEINEIEITLEEANKAIMLKDAIAKLQNNKEYNLVINEHYLRDETLKLVHSKAEPALENAETQHSIQKAIDGIGTFISFLNCTHQQGVLAEKIKAENEEALANLEM